MKFSKILITSATVALIFTACGGGGGSSSDSATKIGVFLDSAVEGLKYECQSSGLSGKTNAKGEYNYKDGDTCTFSVGSTVLGATKGKGVVTPMDLVDYSSGDRTKLKNILRFLQTLDQDRNVSNGITIPKLDGTFDGSFDDESTFNIAFQSFLDANSIDANIIDANTAWMHFEQTIDTTYDANLADEMFKNKMLTIKNGVQLIFSEDKSLELFDPEDEAPCYGTWTLSSEKQLSLSINKCGFPDKNLSENNMEFSIQFADEPAEGVSVYYSGSDFEKGTEDIDSFGDATLPTQATELSFSNVTQTSFTLNWNNSSKNETVYKTVCHKNGTTEDHMIKFLAGSDETNFEVNYDGLNANTTYECRVDTINHMGTVSTDLITVTTASENNSSDDPTETPDHEYQYNEATSISLNNIQAGTQINTYNMAQVNNQIIVRLNTDGTAIFQYIVDNEARWQVIGYSYTINGNTVSFAKNAGSLHLGPDDSPESLSFTATSNTIGAHTQLSVTIPGEESKTYEVYSAFDNSALGL